MEIPYRKGLKVQKNFRYNKGVKMSVKLFETDMYSIYLEETNSKETGIELIMKRENYDQYGNVESIHYDSSLISWRVFFDNYKWDVGDELTRLLKEKYPDRDWDELERLDKLEM
jgi:hypothetical protein